MDWKKLSFSIGLGVLGGIILERQLERRSISPETALKRVKNTVREKYNVDGSWVHMQPEFVERYGLNYDAYHGGITVSTDDQVKHFNFLVDAGTGTVLEFTPDED